MKNAKSFGLYNIKDKSQFFAFVKKNTSVVIDMKQDENNESLGKIQFEVDEELSFDKDGEFQEIEKEKEKSISSLIADSRNGATQTKNENGDLIIEYPNGEKFLKKGLYEIEHIEKEVPQHEEKQNDDPRKDFKKILDPDSKDEVFGREKTNEVKEKAPELERLFIKPKLEEGHSFFFTDEDGKAISFIGYFDDVKNTSDFKNRITVLSLRNMISFLEFCFSAKMQKQFTKIKIPLVFKIGERTFLSYEYFIVSNDREFKIYKRA